MSSAQQRRSRKLATDGGRKRLAMENALRKAKKEARQVLETQNQPVPVALSQGSAGVNLVAALMAVGQKGISNMTAEEMANATKSGSSSSTQY